MLPATAVQMATWRLNRPIACATLVACHASTSASIRCDCHISIGGKQLRRSTRCVGCVRGANFFTNTHRRGGSRRVFFLFLSPNAHQLSLSHITQRAAGDQTICSSTTSSSPFLSGRFTSSCAASTVLPATVLSRRCLAARPGFKIKRREGRKKTSL